MAAGSSGDGASGFDKRMSSLLSAIDTAVGGVEGLKKTSNEEVKERSVEGKSDDFEQECCSHSPHQLDHREERAERRYERDHEAGRDHDRYRDSRRDTESCNTRSDHRRRRQNDYRLRRQQKTPDYVTNPSKWKKYDLTHDGTEGLKRSGMTDDQVNSYAAFNFLRELRERKEREREKEAGEDKVELDSRGERKVMFRKSVKRKHCGEGRESEEDSRSGAGVFAGGGGAGVGVVKMAEYVVGEKGSGGRKRKQLAVIREEEDGTAPQKHQHSSVSLSHLAELDEEED